MDIGRGGGTQQASTVATAEATVAQNQLLLASYLELKVITLHLAEIAGVKFGEEDIELEVGS